MAKFNTLTNLELIKDTANFKKNATPFSEWIETRDFNLKRNKFIPENLNYYSDNYLEFYEA